jgi:cytochrome c oxidase subunit 1
VHYDSIFGIANLVSTIGAYVIGLGMLVLLYAVVSSWRSGPLAPANPWGAKTLEWTVPNPIPLANFEVLPVVIADPYGYGEGDVPLFLPLPAEPLEDAPVVVGSGSGGGSGKDPVLTGPDAPHVTDREKP